MNSLRIRAVKLKPDYGVGTEYQHAVQLSQDGLVWWTVNRFKTFDEALEAARTLLAFVKGSQIVKEEAVLWQGTV
jgi:hypothetical protein